MKIGNEEEEREQKSTVFDEHDDECDEEIQGSLYYLCMGVEENERRNYEWYALDTGGEGESITLTKQNDMRNSDSVLPTEFGCALLESKIYVIGGERNDFPVEEQCLTSPSPPLKSVFVFDIDGIRKWRPAKEMKAARSHPKVVAIPKRRRIYVYGSRPYSVDESIPQPWVECYCLKDDEWKDVKPPPTFFLEANPYPEHAVALGLGGIIFWNRIHICFFNLDQETWLTLQIADLSSPWDNRFHMLKHNFYDILPTQCLIVVNNVLYWFCKNDIYAYNLASSKHPPENLSPIYTLPFWDGPRSECYGNPLLLPHLIGTGNMEDLCLIWSEMDGYGLHSVKFPMEGGKDDGQVRHHLHPLAGDPYQFIYACLHVVRRKDDEVCYHSNRDADKPHVIDPEVCCGNHRLKCKNMGQQQIRNLLRNLPQTIYERTVESSHRVEEKKDAFFGKLERSFFSPVEPQLKDGKDGVKMFLESADLGEYFDVLGEYEMSELVKMGHEQFMDLGIPCGRRKQLVRCLEMKQIAIKYGRPLIEEEVVVEEEEEEEEEVEEDDEVEEEDQMKKKKKRRSDDHVRFYWSEPELPKI